MMGFQLVDTYYTLLDMGLFRSKREFSRALDHHWSYIRDVEQRDKDEFRVPPPTVERLRAYLQALTPYLSKGSAAEIERVLAKIDQHTAVTLALRRVTGARSSGASWTSNG